MNLSMPTSFAHCESKTTQMPVCRFASSVGSSVLKADVCMRSNVSNVIANYMQKEQVVMDT